MMFSRHSLFSCIFCASVFVYIFSIQKKNFLVWTHCALLGIFIFTSKYCFITETYFITDMMTGIVPKNKHTKKNEEQKVKTTKKHLHS